MLRLSYLLCWLMLVILSLVSVVGGGLNVLRVLMLLMLICVIMCFIVDLCRKFMRFLIFGSLGMWRVCYC